MVVKSQVKSDRISVKVFCFWVVEFYTFGHVSNSRILKQLECKKIQKIGQQFGRDLKKVI